MSVRLDLLAPDEIGRECEVTHPCLAVNYRRLLEERLKRAEEAITQLQENEVNHLQRIAWLEEQLTRLLGPPRSHNVEE